MGPAMTDVSRAALACQISRRGVLAGLSFAGLLLVQAGAVFAHSYKIGSISIGHLWAPPPREGDDGLPVYGALLNQGDSVARLIGASTPVAENVRFRLKEDSGITWPQAIDLQPGKPFGMAPWREHLWLSGLREALKEGDTCELTLDFADQGKVAVTVILENEGGH